MLGMKWEAPKKIYGQLESFTLTLKRESDSEQIVETIPAEPCHVWNTVFCHTVTRLEPNENYIVMVIFTYLIITLVGSHCYINKYVQ